MPRHNFILITIIALFAACSKEAAPVAPWTPAAKKPAIVQARQTLNLTPVQTFQAVLATLANRKIPVKDSNLETGVIETDIIEMTDQLCDLHRSNNAPLACRTRLSFKIQPYDRQASALNIRYKETCSVNEDLPVACADSNAEKLMLAIVEDIRAYDEKIDRGE